MAPKSKPKPRGFAAMNPDLQRELAQKGGVKVSSNRKHMRLIGHIGGANSHLRPGKVRLRYVPPQKKGSLGKAVIADRAPNAQS